MKNDREIMNSIRAAIDDCTRGIEEMPSLQYRIARKAKGEEPMAKKISGALALAIVLFIMLASVAFAVTNGFGILYYHPEQSENKAYTDKILSLNQTWEGEYLSATIHEAVFDGMKMSFTMSIVPRDETDPIYVIPRIRATANGKALNTFVDHAGGLYMNDGFWIPCMEPDLAYDYDRIDVDVMLTEDMRTFAPTAENVEWEITFDVLHPEWPIEYTEEDEPMIGEPEWTDAEYAAYDQQFADACQAKHILLNRAAMLGSFASALASWQDPAEDMPFIDWFEDTLTREAFSMKEQGVFRFSTEPHLVRHAKNPVRFTLPDGLVAELQDLTVSVDTVEIILKITRPDSDEPLQIEHFQSWNVALLAENADTKLLGGVCGPDKDGSGLLYTAQWSINGPTDRIILLPVDTGLSREFTELNGKLPEAYQDEPIYVDLE